MAARERERLRQAELESDRLREELETVANHLAHERAERERDAARWRARESAANETEQHESCELSIRRTRRALQVCPLVGPNAGGLASFHWGNYFFSCA